MKNKLAIFDLDGTLFNTNDVNYLAYKQALEEESYLLDYNYFCTECNGKYYKDFLPIISTSDDNVLEKIHNRKKELYSCYLSNAKINKNLFNLIDVLKDTYFLSIVSSASKKNCFEILKKFDKLNLFDLIITNEDVKNVKPHPEGFIKAMQYFNVSAEDTIIFEDSLSGLKAALQSRASVYKVEKF